MNDATTTPTPATASATTTPTAPRQLAEHELSLLTAGDRLTVVDFSAPWCGPCRRLEPLLGELAAELDGSVDFYKVDVDSSPELAVRYGVQAVPTLLFLRAGKVVDRLVGLPPKPALAERLRGHLAR